MPKTFAAGSIVVGLSAVVIGCGSSGGADEPVDAGVDAAEACHPMGRREAPLHEDEVRACATCLEEHARLTNPVFPTGSIVVDMVAVPGGVIITDFSYGTLATFVTTDGERVSLEELPLDNVPFEDRLDGHPLQEYQQELHDLLGLEWTPALYGWGDGRPWALPVQGTNRVWIGTRHTAWDDQFLNREDLVLYEYGPDGWRRVAAGHIVGRGSLRRAALDTGELVAWMLDDRMLRVRANEDGTVDMRFRSLGDDLDIPADPRRNWLFVGDLWALPTGDLVMMVGENVTLDGAPQAWRAWVGVLDGDLEPLQPWRVFGAEVDDPAYVVGEAPFARGTFNKHVGPDRRAFVLAYGTLAGTGAASWQHRWGMRVDAAGELEQEPPGILLNPEHYLLAQDVGSAEVSGAVHGLPGGRTAVIWDDRIAGGGPGYTWGQVVEPDGSTLFEEPQVLAPSINERALWPRWSQDGAGYAYLRSFEFDGVPTPDDRLAIQRVGGELDYEWPAPLVIQTCAEILDGPFNLTTVGAHDEGVWVLWADAVPTVDGGAIQVTKVTLIRPDGTLAWE
jgi:hypothetical protein